MNWNEAWKILIFETVYIGLMYAFLLGVKKLYCKIAYVYSFVVQFLFITFYINRRLYLLNGRNLDIREFHLFLGGLNGLYVLIILPFFILLTYRSMKSIIQNGPNKILKALGFTVAFIVLGYIAFIARYVYLLTFYGFAP